MQTGTYLFLLSIIFFGKILTAQDCEVDYTADDKPYPDNVPALQDYSVDHMVQWYKVDLESLEKPYLKDKELFYKERYESLQFLLADDYFLFVDSLQALVNDIGERLLNANEIKKDERLQFLVSRSGIPNASCRGEGTIVINAGLLIHLSSVDELAFILAHELAHHHLDHVNKNIEEQITFLNSKETNKKIRDAKNEKELANEELRDWLKVNALDFSKHSRNDELLTDSLGMEFFMKAGFYPGAVLSTLDLLKDIDNRAEADLKLEQLFNFSDYPWKEEWGESQLSGLSLVKISDEEEELYRTHPEVSERIAQAKRLLSEQEKNDTPDFCKWKNQLELEILERHYETRNLFSALVQGLQIAGLSPENTYANTIVGHCLLDLCIARKKHKFGKYIPAPNMRMRQDYFEVATFLDNLSFSALKNLTRRWLGEHCKLDRENEMERAIKLKLEWMENDFLEKPEGVFSYFQKWPISIFLTQKIFEDPRELSKKKKKKK